MSDAHALYNKTTDLILKGSSNSNEKENSNEKPVHPKCIEFFLIDVYKYYTGLSADILNTIFKQRQNTYNLRNFHAF